ncbi:unnamed protein product [Peniophora sp. CBMAI 1063]|nr:unnamed protein product [Peniophora sp. CBMAI 1063]
MVIWRMVEGPLHPTVRAEAGRTACARRNGRRWAAGAHDVTRSIPAPDSRLLVPFVLALACFDSFPLTTTFALSPPSPPLRRRPFATRPRPICTAEASIPSPQCDRYTVRPTLPGRYPALPLTFFDGRSYSPRIRNVELLCVGRRDASARRSCS